MCLKVMVNCLINIVMADLKVKEFNVFCIFIAIKTLSDKNKTKYNQTKLFLLEFSLLKNSSSSHVKYLK